MEKKPWAHRHKLIIYRHKLIIYRRKLVIIFILNAQKLAKACHVFFVPAARWLEEGLPAVQPAR